MGLHICRVALLCILLVCFVLLYANPNLFIYISTILQFYISNCSLFCPIITNVNAILLQRLSLHRTLYNVLHIIIIINTSGLPRSYVCMCCCVVDNENDACRSFLCRKRKLCGNMAEGLSRPH